MKIGDKIHFDEGIIKFKKIETYNNKNYKSLVGSFEIQDKKNNLINLNPEIRIYNQPSILTSEADIKTSFFYDKFLVFNILKYDNFLNVIYQIKTFMLWIWISILLLATSGLVSFIKKIK